MGYKGRRTEGANNNTPGLPVGSNSRWSHPQRRERLENKQIGGREGGCGEVRNSVRRCQILNVFETFHCRNSGSNRVYEHEGQKRDLQQ